MKGGKLTSLLQTFSSDDHGEYGRSHEYLSNEIAVLSKGAIWRWRLGERSQANVLDSSWDPG